MIPWLLIGVGAAVFVASTLMRLRNGPASRVRPVITAFLATIALVASVSGAAYASHTSVGYTTVTVYPSPTNYYRVYLSPPTHANSGGRGECGWEENINGRHWSYYAGLVYTGSGFGSLSNRTYEVAVGSNPRDDSEYPLHVNYGNNWGADVYIVTHTNASVGCGNSASYLLVMYQSSSSNSSTLRNQLLNDVDGGTPGGTNTWTCDSQNLYECLTANYASYRAYVELFFHTNVADKNWFQGTGAEGSGGVNESWRYGAAVDYILNYPR